jgi:hypothetical protein
MTWTDTSFGAFVETGTPQGGSGGAYGWFPDGVLTIVSVSAAGDTILWKSTSEGPAIGGSYSVTGGSAQGEGGAWSARLVQGQAITAKTLTVPDGSSTGWVEVLLALTALTGVALLGFRWISKIPRRPLGAAPLSTSLASKLYGVGGWMLWFLVGQSLTILFMLAQLPEIWSLETQSSWSMGTLLPGLRFLLTIESVMHVGQIVLPTVGIYLTVKHHPWTPRFWFLYLMWLAAYGIIDIAGAGYFQQQSHRFMGSVPQPGEEGDVWVAMTANARLIFWALVWSLYWIRSVRVKQTFGRTALESVPV